MFFEFSPDSVKANACSMLGRNFSKPIKRKKKLMNINHPIGLAYDPKHEVLFPLKPRREWMRPVDAGLADELATELAKPDDSDPRKNWSNRYVALSALPICDCMKERGKLLHHYQEL
jgi:hypothetical protein